MPSAQPDSAGIIAPPPVLYLGALVIGFGIHAVSPQPMLSPPDALRVFGALLLALGGGFARWSFVTMRQAGARANPRERSMVLATGGPFRLSRNPIYLAMTAMYLGIAFLGNSWWPLLLLPPLLVVMHWGVVLREERHLAKQFGEGYGRYKSTTRRWL